MWVYSSLVADKVVLIQRGECSFVSKAIRAQEAGASGAIITDNDDKNDQLTISMVDDTTNRKISIPVAFLLGMNGWVAQTFHIYFDLLFVVHLYFYEIWKVQYIGTNNIHFNICTATIIKNCANIKHLCSHLCLFTLQTSPYSGRIALCKICNCRDY